MTIEQMNKAIQDLTANPDKLRDLLEDYCPYCAEQGRLVPLTLETGNGMEWTFCIDCDHQSEPERSYTGEDYE